MRAQSLALAAMAAMIVLATSAMGQECRTYEPYLAGSLGLCAGVVDYRYYANSSVSQVELEAEAFDLITDGNSNLALLLKLLPTSCGTALKEAVCKVAFPECVTVPPFFLSSYSVEAAGYNDTYALTSEVICGMTEYFWDDSSNICGVAMPVMPCRGNCEALSLKANNIPETVSDITIAGTCPLVSGLFYPKMLSSISASSDDQAVLSEYSTMLASCGSSYNATCAKTPYTLTVLKALDLAPTCEATMDTTLGSMDVFPDTSQTTLKALISAQITKATAATGNSSDCAPEGSGLSISCDLIAKAYGCNNSTSTSEIEKTYDVLPESSVCAGVVGYSTSTLGAEDNQDSALIQKLAVQDEIYQLLGGQSEEQAAECLSSGKTDTYLRTFYVPTTVGMAPLASRFDENSTEQDLGTWDEESCPVEWESSPKFANYPATSPLCTYGSYSAYNSRDCLLLRINYSVGSFPGWASVRCQVAFREYACSQGLMKPEVKSLCLVPDALGGCNAQDLAEAYANDQIPLSYALPRFASRQICQLYATECASLLPSLPASAQPDCDGILNETECANGESSFWGCLNSFNGVEKFPESIQTFANASNLGELETYLAMVNDPTTASLPSAAFDNATLDVSSSMTSDVADPTISKLLYNGTLTNAEMSALKDEYCSCPEPLVVPDAADGDTINSATCCALPCLGTMLTQSDMQSFGRAQFALSLIGILMATFMVVTWGIFKEKSKQFMTFWLSVCSFNVTLGMLVNSCTENFDLTNNMCLDNSTPVTLLTVGFTTTTFQGIWLIFFASALCAWWLVQAFDLHRKLVLGARTTDRSRRAYHIFAWTIPVIEIAFVLGYQSVGFQAPTPWSFITTDRSKYLEWLAFYMFIACCFVIGSALMIRVVWTIYQHVKRSTHLNQGTNSSGRFAKRMAMYRTPMLFVAVFIFVWLTVFWFRFSTFFRESTYEEEAEAWVSCLLLNYANGITDPATNSAANITMLINAPDDQVGCGMTQPGGLRMNPLWLTFVVIMSQSILIFLVFGMHKRNYQLWAAKLGIKTDTLATIEDTNDSYSKGSKSKETMPSNKSFQMTPSSFNSNFEESRKVSFYNMAGPSRFPATPPPPGKPPAAPPVPGAFDL